MEWPPLFSKGKHTSSYPHSKHNQSDSKPKVISSTMGPSIFAIPLSEHKSLCQKKDFSFTAAYSLTHQRTQNF